MSTGATLKTARAAKKRAAEVFEPLVGECVAVGITRLGFRRYGLKVNLSTQPDDDVELPDEIEGVPVRVEIVGRLVKRPSTKRSGS